MLNNTTSERRASSNRPASERRPSTELRPTSERRLSVGINYLLDCLRRFPYHGILYLIIWLFILVPLALRALDPRYGMEEVNTLSNIHAATAVLAATISFTATRRVFYWLFDRKAIQLYGALPIKRVPLFFLSFVAILAPLWLAVVLASFIFLVLLGFNPAAFVVISWAVKHLLTLFVFCTLATCCLLCTGRSSVAPVCYLMVNLFASCFSRIAVSYYSMAGAEVSLTIPFWIDWLSPLVQMGSADIPKFLAAYPPHTLSMWHIFVTYSVVAILLLMLSAYLFKRRKLEHAGDPFIHPKLRLVMNVLLSLGIGVSLAEFVLLLTTFDASSYGIPLALLLGLATLFAGAIYLVLEAILHRGFTNMRSRIPGFIISMTSTLVLGLVLIIPAYKAARTVPDLSQIETARFSELSMTFESDEGKAAVQDIQRVLIEALDTPDRPNTTNTMSSYIIYNMKDGTSSSTDYVIPLDQLNNPNYEPVRKELDSLQYNSAILTELNQQLYWSLASNDAQNYLVSMSAVSDGDRDLSSQAIPASQRAKLFESLTLDSQQSGAVFIMPMRLNTTQSWGTLSITKIGEDGEYENDGLTLYLSQDTAAHTLEWAREYFHVQDSTWPNGVW